MLSLAMLGPVQIHIDPHLAIKFRSSNAQALLCYLAVEHALGSASCRRQILMEFFWPGSLPQSAQANLRQALYQLRQALPAVTGLNGEPVPLMLSDRQTMELNPEVHMDLDVAAFTELTNSQDLAQEAQAVLLYRGDFLADFSLPANNPFEFWAEQWREKLRHTMLKSLSNLTRHELSQAAFGEAERYARRQLEIDDLQEDGHYQLILALAGSKRRHAALQHYDAYSQLLKTELDSPPSKEIAALAEAIRQGGENFAGVEGRLGSIMTEIEGSGSAATLPASTASLLTEIPHNLPLHTTPIIGRQPELKALIQLLEASSKNLITITGQGGIGKTRLAVAAGKSLLKSRNFRDGVYFVHLAGLSDCERIVPVIADAIQLRLERGENQLLAYLRTKQMLLVLDNFEHLLEGSTLVNRILQAAPGVKILTTSLERLNLQDEQVFPLRGFLVKDKAGLEDARQLFIQATRRIRPDFQETSENQPFLNRICRLVDGMPLALELAAAWMDTLSAEDIAAEIQQSLDILQADFRDIPERHRSMRAVFNSTWQNLSAGNQKFLAQFSVFRGGFRREAAAAICQATLRDLSELVRKSLLNYDSTEDRYTIHELLRQYSAAKLDLTDVRERHRAYYFDWLIEQTDAKTGSEQEAALILIEKEMDNIRAAVHQALQFMQLDWMDQVIQSLGWFYFRQNRQQEGILYFSYILSQLSLTQSRPTRILFWVTAWKVNLLGIILRYDETLQLWAQGKALLAELSNEYSDIRSEQAFSDYVEGYRLYFIQPARSRQLLQQAYRLMTEINNQWMAGYCLFGISRAARNQWDLVGAEAAAAEGLAVFEALDYKPAIGEANRLLANLAAIAGRYDEAERLLRDDTAGAIDKSQPWSSVVDGGLDKLRMVYFFSGQFENALDSAIEYQKLSEAYDFTVGLMFNMLVQGQIALHQGRYQKACKFGETALNFTWKPKSPTFLAQTYILLAQADIALEKLGSAKAWMEALEPDDHFPRTWSSRSVAGIDFYRGVWMAITKQPAAGWAHLRTELEIVVQRKDGLNLANVLALAAFLKTIDGKSFAALELYAAARQHPFVANSQWFEDVIGREIQQISEALPPEEALEAMVRGADLDPWMAADRLLAATNQQP